MKLTVNPPPPPPEATYTLELTRPEMVRLARLSYSGEPSGASDSHSFYGACPVDVRQQAKEETAKTRDIGFDPSLW